ncbi:MAG: hypothetical protein JXC32_20700 [Anaerolineae bacterium]|nr:hypothetical protein [Anaerolineae bacterium]
MSLEYVSIPKNLLERVLELERRLDDLEGYAALPTADPGSGDGEITYIEILEEIELTAGADIDLSGASPNYTIARAGNVILLKHGDGTVMAEYAHSGAGLDAASAAAASGDVVELPAGTISGDHTLAAGVHYVGASRAATVLTGKITVASGCTLENLTIRRSESSAGEVTGLSNSASGTAHLYGCNIEVENTGTGDAYGVELPLGSIIIAWNCYLYGNASGGGDGYAGYWDGLSAGTLAVFGGWARGSTDPFN